MTDPNSERIGPLMLIYFICVVSISVLVGWLNPEILNHENGYILVTIIGLGITTIMAAIYNISVSLLEIVRKKRKDQTP